jgi:hypothetical protein
MLRKHHLFSKIHKSYNVKLTIQILSKQINGKFEFFKTTIKHHHVSHNFLTLYCNNKQYHNITKFQATSKVVGDG